MAKYGLLIDSTVYLSQKIIDDNNIKVVSLNVEDKMESFKEVDVTVPFIFDRQKNGAHWKTSAPAPGEFLNAFEEFIEAGCEQVFCVLLSKNISGTYQSALLARNMLDDSQQVHIFDTELCAFANEMIMLELIDMVNSEKTAEEIISRITTIIDHSYQMFTVENLFSLVKGGRLSLAKATIGTVLRIKPVIKVIDGKLQLVKNERTYKKLNNYILDNIRESLESRDKLTFYVTSQYSLEQSQTMKNLLVSEFPDARITFTEYLGPVFSIHIGKKGYGISWFSE